MGGGLESLLGGGIICQIHPDGGIDCRPPERRKVIGGFYDDQGGLEGLSIAAWYSTEDEWNFFEYNVNPPGLLFMNPYIEKGAFVVSSKQGPVVPEPSTMLLFSTGFLGVFVKRRRRS